MYPQITVNFVAIIAAVVASFIFGFAWYGPLFGAAWRKLMNMPADMKPSLIGMLASIIINLIGTFLVAFVLAYALDIWRPSVWKIEGRADEPFYFYGFMAGFTTWLGFFVPQLLNTVAWEGKSWKLFGFNAAYHLINLMLIAMILAAWH
jgi:fluoride ion exporter CrcB/FEX